MLSVTSPVIWHVPAWPSAPVGTSAKAASRSDGRYSRTSHFALNWKCTVLLNVLRRFAP